MLLSEMNKWKVLAPYSLFPVLFYNPEHLFTRIPEKGDFSRVLKEHGIHSPFPNDIYHPLPRMSNWCRREGALPEIPLDHMHLF